MWVAEGSYDTVLADASNIGQGGLCVEINHEIAQGTKVDIEINFNDSTPPFRCQGSVVRCRQQDNKVYNIGVQFGTLSEPNRVILEGKISQLLNLEKKDKS
jgi:Tfp pilus assembly protein PilZ